MPEQEPGERVRNFFEVALGYGIEHAVREADRCLDCKDPRCLRGCPVAVDIPGFLRKVVAKDFRGAYDLLAGTNVLPAICGRVCPQEEQCEGACTVGDVLEPVAIGRVERWLGDLAIEQGWSTVARAESNGFRVGIVGSGPAGIACAADLARLGCGVTVFDALHAPGGVLRYGIPEFRLPKRVLDAEIEKLRRLGVEIECNTLVGRLFTIEQMIEEQGFHAVFIATGAGAPKFMGIPGEGLSGVVSANELLTRCNLMQAGRSPEFDTPLGLGRRVAVIGAGNTAMDALRVSLRAGADHVACVYRRSRAECPARAEELHHAEQEGVAFHWLASPLAILDDGHGGVRGLRCTRMQLGAPDDSGRRRPEALPDSEFELELDTVVYAIGTNANPIIGQTSHIKLGQRGYLETDASLATSLAGVYAGGDIVTGSATVILAMGAGRRAARSIAAYLGIGEPEPHPGAADGVFGIEPGRHGFVRIRAQVRSREPSAGLPSAAELCPAALGPLLDVAKLRHGYPLALMSEGEADAHPVRSLRDLFDAALQRSRTAFSGDDLLRDALRLEAHVRARTCDARAGSREPGSDLRELAAQASRALLERVPTADRGPAASRLDELLAALPAATLIPCSRRGIELLVERLWQLQSETRERAMRDELDTLARALDKLLRTDFMTTQAAFSPAFLAASLGDCERRDFDLEALSRLLTPQRAASPTEPPRMARIRALQSALARARPYLAIGPPVFHTCAAAIESLDRRARVLADLLATAQQAHLETSGEGGTRDARVDAASWSRAAVLAQLPALLVVLDADRLAESEQALLLTLLSTDLPVTVLCTSSAVAEDGLPRLPSVPGGGSFVGGRAALLAALAHGLGNVRVVQTALSHLPSCVDEVEWALSSPGPALIAVYTGEGHPHLPAYLASAAARAARVFPNLKYDPVTACLDIARNPSAAATWPRAPFRGEDENMRRVDHDEAFTAAHLLATSADLASFAWPVPSDAWDESLIPVDVFPGTMSPGSRPYVSMIEADGRLFRVALSGPLIEQNRRVADRWHRLQQAARAGTLVRSDPATPSGDVEATSAVGPIAAAAEPRPGKKEESAGVVASSEALAAATDVTAWIETTRCSSCDECVNRNPRMFAYDADKRAVLRDPRAGTYRDLVEAAEQCKMAVIHPGEPWDSAESDLEELRRRAAAFG